MALWRVHSLSFSQRLRSTVSVQYQDNLQPQQLQSQLTVALQRLLWIQFDCTRPR